MAWRVPETSEKELFNSFVTHPLQSWEWGEFRTNTGISVSRRINTETKEAFQLTMHKVPHMPFSIGYLPKGTQPNSPMLEELKNIGQDHNALFIKLEPNIKASEFKKSKGLIKSSHPLFTKYTFVLDLTPSEDELLAKMHPKTRYNIRVAQKRGVEIVEDDSEKGFEEYLDLTWETTKRQGFYAHTKHYHKTMWETLIKEKRNEGLQAKLFKAVYEGKILVTWVVFLFNNVIYYPYGASSNLHREVMASNLMMWEMIRLGKKEGCTSFDMWGSLGPNPNTRDPWYGFHRFKMGYGAELVECAGSFDLVINPTLYPLYNSAHFLRNIYLRTRALLPR